LRGGNRAPRRVEKVGLELAGEKWLSCKDMQSVACGVGVNHNGCTCRIGCKCAGQYVSNLLERVFAAKAEKRFDAVRGVKINSLIKAIVKILDGVAVVECAE